MEHPPERDGTPALNGARVLVVEDDFIILVELESILIDAGAQIAGLCRTVKDALAVIDHDGLAAAILDVRLGRETVAPVAQELSKRGIPFFFYTGQADMDSIRMEWPECKIVSKPAHSCDILAAFADMLK
jgi:DNA-binding NtrC family response regulator